MINYDVLYKIKEIDFVGHETTYYVYLDLNSPLLDIEAKLYGKDKTLTQTISKADIPANNELVFYYESFKITNVVEDDKWFDIIWYKHPIIPSWIEIDDSKECISHYFWQQLYFKNK